MALPSVVLWSTCKHRNECLFKAIQPNLEDLCDLVKVRVAMCIKSSPTPVVFSVNDIVSNL